MNLAVTLTCSGATQSTWNCVAEPIEVPYTPQWRATIDDVMRLRGWNQRLVSVDSVEAGVLALQAEIFCPSCDDRLLGLDEQAMARLTEQVGPARPEVLADLLLLVGVTVTSETVAGWSLEMREQAEEWAALEHLSASDNPVVRKPKPAFLED